MNWELSDVQAGFRKGRGTRDQIANIFWITEKAREFQKNVYFCFTALTVWIAANCGKFLKRWKYQTTLLASWETCMQVKKQQLDPDVEQWTCSKLGKEYIKAVCFYHAYLTYAEYIMWNAELDGSQAGIKITRRNMINLRWWQTMPP